MNKKKVGIITMHKVLNYGSVLQAISLQDYIDSLGFDCRIINYYYPNNFHRDYINPFYLFTKCCFVFLRRIIFKIRYGGDKEIKLKRFMNTYYKLQGKYKTVQDIKNNPPVFDIYVCGSDQIWNMNFTRGDDIFMLSFAPHNSWKISFASSAGLGEIPDNYKKIFQKNLDDFKAISMRDTKCISSLENLIGKKILTVCDPVFLHNKSYYEHFAQMSRIKLPEKYILIYLLDYMYNPFPEVLTLITNIKAQLNLPLVFIWGKTKQKKLILPEKYFPVPSVEDFLALIKNASFIITSSFHGTAFSIIFEKQFYSILNPHNNDFRIPDLLSTVGLENHGVSYNQDSVVVSEIDWHEKKDLISDYIRQSQQFLKNALGNNMKRKLK